jgi:hypothetical protein
MVKAQVFKTTILLVSRGKQKRSVMSQVMIHRESVDVLLERMLEKQIVLACNPTSALFHNCVCVGKEMLISRIVVAVPNATVVLLD